MDIILNVFYPPVRELRDLIEENFRRKGRPYVPINGGSSLRSDPWAEKYLRFDDTGDNISDLNPILNEMTSIYWYWKNVITDGITHVGFNHYRRFFSLEDILDFESYDIIVSKPIWSSDKISLAYQYKLYHVLQDLQTLIDVIRNDFDSAWGENFRKYLLGSGTNLAPCNMFVMRKDLFAEWCSFVFPILFGLRTKICETEEFHRRDNYQKRALCFLSERMFNYWYFLKVGAGCRTKEVQMVEKLDYKPQGVNERHSY